MRAGPLAVVATLLCGACTAGDRADFGRTVSDATTTSTVAPTTTTVVPTTVPTTVAAGSVTLRIRTLLLPDVRAGGTGFRVLVRAESPRLTVRRKGAGAPVRACPVAGTTAAVTERECVDLAPQATVEIASAGGVELRAATVAATLDEVEVTYVAAARSTTLVTPTRPAGTCAARPCEATYSLVPPRPGAFVLDGRGSGGRPRLVLTATGPAGSTVSNRTLATVEGGGLLSIRATLEAGSEAVLLHHEEGPDAVGPLTAEILWP
jgi:hypothetical protein